MKWLPLFIRMFMPTANQQLLPELHKIVIWCDFKVAYHLFIPSNDN